MLASIRRALQVEGALPNVGSRNSQGDPKHQANTARATFGADGTGVRIGVLSDGVASLAASQALGDLGTVTVLPGQAGSGDEGTAMLEIIHDLAPGAAAVVTPSENRQTLRLGRGRVDSARSTPPARGGDA